MSTLTNRTRTLVCACCGEPTKGRQWYNRDDGYGICPPCGNAVAEREGEAAARSYYGRRGIHWDTEAAQEAETPSIFQRLDALLRDSPTSQSGLAARRLLWSMWTTRLSCGSFSGPPMVNLWSCLSVLDEISRLEIGQMVALSQADREREIKRLLEQTGEWTRIDSLPAFSVEG